MTATKFGGRRGVRAGATSAKVTSAMVAERAGVSRATVNYVLNDTPDQTISSATRERVLAAAEELGYVPNSAARSLRMGHSSTALFPLSGVPLTPLWGQIVEATALALAGRGFTLVADFTSYATPRDQVEAAIRLNPAVVIDPVTEQSRTLMDLFVSQGVAVLAPSDRSDPLGLLAHRSRDVQLAHLISRERRRLLIAGAAFADPGSDTERDRHARLHTQASSAGAALEIRTVPFTSEALEQLVDDLPDPASDEAVDGIAVSNDFYGVALLTALHRAGYRVPDDIAVIGLDDDPVAQASVPALTTVAWDLEALAEGVAGGVQNVLAGEASTMSLDEVGCTLVVREST